MSQMRAHILLTADGKSVVGTAKEVRSALSQTERQTLETGRAAATADRQHQAHSRALMAGRRAALLLTASLGGLAGALSAREIVQAGLIADGIESAMLGAAGGTLRAAQETKFLRDESERLGLVFDQNVLAYAKLIAAGNAAGVSQRSVQEIFTGFAETGVVFDLSAENMVGAMRAVEQMMSKGYATAEELKLQLGDRIPGIMPVAAKAMGVTVAELMKMLEQGQVLADDFLPKLAAQLRTEFGDGLANKLNGPRVAFNRLQNDLYNLKVEAAQGGFLDGLIEGSEELRDTLGDDGFREEVRALFETIGGGTADAAQFMSVLAKNSDLVKAGLLGLVGIKLVPFLTQSAAALNRKRLAMIAQIQVAPALRQAELNTAFAARAKAKADLSATQAERLRTKGTMERIALNGRILAAENAVTAATGRVTAAQLAAARSSSLLATAGRGLGLAMGALGGPLGIAVIGLTGLYYAAKKYEEATAAKITDSEIELALMERNETLLGSLGRLTRENASAKLDEAESIREVNRARLEGIQATVQSLESRYSDKISKQVGRDMLASRAYGLGPVLKMFNEIEDQSKVTITKVQADFLGLLGDPRLQDNGIDGMSIDFGVLQDAIARSSEQTEQWSGKVDASQSVIDEIRERIKNWATEETDRSASQLSSAQKSLATLRARLELETQMAGLSKEQAEIEKIAFDLVAKSKKAGLDLTLEEARAEAALHVQKRARAEAEAEFTELQTGLEARLKAAYETPEETKIRTEALSIYRAAQAAGIDLTLEEITLRLQNIQAIEDETDAIADADEARADATDTYEDWLAARREDLRLAGLTRDQQEVEKLTRDRIALARRAGIELSEAEVRAWAIAHVSRLNQLDEHGRRVQGLQDAYLSAQRNIEDRWNGMWEDVLSGNFDSFEDFFDDIDNLFGRLAKSIAAQMIIKPILDQSGLSGLLGIGGLGGGGGNFLNLLGGGAGGGGGSLLNGLLGGVAGQTGLLTSTLPGILGQIPGIGGALASGSSALGGLLGSASGAVTGALGAIPGIGGALAGIAGALGPIGLIGGAIFGLTTLLKKAPRLQSTFGSDGSGDLRITRSETRGIDDETTQGIADSINQILDGLGAEIRGGINFDVLFKPEKDFLAVRGFGRDRQFNADQIEEAVAYTVGEILKSDSVEGLAEGLKEAIRQAGEISSVDQLEGLVGEYTQAQGLSASIEEAIARRLNPEQFELDQLKEAQAARRASIEQYRQMGYVTDDVVSQLDQLEQLELDEVLSRLGDSATEAGGALSSAAKEARASIADYLAGLNVANDNSPFSTVQRRQNAETQYDEQLALARDGDTEALAGISDYADRLLELDREATSSAAERLTLYNRVVSNLTGLAGITVDSPASLGDIVDAVRDIPVRLDPPLTDIGGRVTTGLDDILSGTGGLGDLGDRVGLTRDAVQTGTGNLYTGLDGWFDANGGFLNDIRLDQNQGLGDLSVGLGGLDDRLVGVSGTLTGRLDGLQGINNQGFENVRLASEGAGTGVSDHILDLMMQNENDFSALGGGLDNIYGRQDLGVQSLNDTLAGLQQVNQAGFSSVDLQSRDSEIVSTLTYELGRLNDGVVTLQGRTDNVATAIAETGGAQLDVLENLDANSLEQVRLLEVNGSGGTDGGGGPPPP